jgi:Mannosylglycerate hydrolase MGH1-like glycoside hydrolase domain
MTDLLPGRAPWYVSGAMRGSPRFEKMKEAVAALYERNRQKGTAPWCGLDYDFVCPSTGTYPFQWLWDSCFHAIVLSHFDRERARSEIRSLLANAQPDGFVAHVTFWQREAYEAMLATYSIAYRTPYLSDCIQPPVLAEAVYAASRGEGGSAFLDEVLPKTRRFFDWLDRMRDPDRDGLMATLQPDESGLDHTPKYDAYLGITGSELAQFTAAWERVAGPYADVGRDHERMFALDRFVMEDVLVNAIYGENQRVLAALLRERGDDAGAAEMDRRADRTTASLVAKCWDEDRGLFFDLAGRREEPQRVNTVSSLMPLVLRDLPPSFAESLAAHVESPREYAAPFPVPSVAMNESSYRKARAEERLVWRGPTWINTNWYVARGLRRHGREDLARTIEDRSAALVEQSGFREYYDPVSGEGFGAHGFSWTALALDMLASLEGRRPY